MKTRKYNYVVTEKKTAVELGYMHVRFLYEYKSMYKDD